MIQKISRISILLVLSILILSSCKRRLKGQKESSYGNTSEIMVVTDNRDQWESTIGDSTKSILAAPMVGLPQSEPHFKLMNVGKNNFNELFRKSRNILILDIDNNIKEPLLTTEKDKYVIPQRIVTIKAPNQKELLQYFRQNAIGIVELFNKSERDRIVNTYKSIQDVETEAAIQKKFDIEMVIPEGFFIAVDKPNFVWLRKETADFSQGILIYTENYYSSNQLSPEHIIAYRDSLTSAYLPGENPNTYMIIEQRKKAGPPVFDTIPNLNQHYTVRTRGLWKLFNDFYGGPFTSYSIIDEKNNRIVTVDGFVYAPKKKKRDYVKQLDAILYNVKIKNKAAAKK
ncbi:MAG: DUF4837 family protein [Bacteroidales bacterium]